MWPSKVDKVITPHTIPPWKSYHSQSDVKANITLFLKSLNYIYLHSNLNSPRILVTWDPRKGGVVFYNHKVIATEFIWVIIISTCSLVFPILLTCYINVFHELLWHVSFFYKKVNIGNERDKRVGVMQRESKHWFYQTSNVAARRADKQKTSLSEYTRMLDKSPVHLFQCMAEESKYKGGGYGAKTGETRFRKTQVRGCLQASAVFVVELGSDSLASGGGGPTPEDKASGWS